MKYRLQSDKLSVEILSKGAELCSVQNTQKTEFIWQAGLAWPRHAPVLFPIVGRLKNNTYTFEGKSYKLPQHGFARDKEFLLTETSKNQCVFELRSDQSTKEVYPFDFLLRIGYVLVNSTLTCSYEIVNTGNQKMFFSIGAHPGFSCKVQPEDQYNQYYIQLEQRNFLQTQLRDGLRTNDTRLVPLEEKNLRLSPTLFDQDALVFENGQINSAVLCSDSRGPVVKLHCKGWPFFGIWAKKGCDEFVCLEPWQGIADHSETSGRLEDKEGMLQLEPGQRHNCQFLMEFY